MRKRHNYIFNTDFSITISTIVLAITAVFRGGGEGTGGPLPKDKGTLKKWLDRLKKKAVEALAAIVGNVAGARFLGKTVGFVAEHTWVLIVFVAGLVGW